MIEIQEKRKRDAARKQAQRKVPATQCHECGKSTGKLERHHTDYDRPTDVRVYCPKCHRKADQQDGRQRVVQKRACKVCGTVFLPERNNRSITLCGSPECRSAYGKSSAAKRWIGLNRSRPCAVCGKTFQYKRQREKTCGRSCGNVLAWKKRK